ncbi:hypothetical protein [Chromobacterium violaceum]|uniref:hypothetical protein n=1 Tax=Chromobacterium violaceum TaxID=536 RepID=UPI00111C2F4A|nr:hypothetical protein [Chromobacterium violaceum]
MKIKNVLLAGVLSVINLASAQYVRPGQSMGMDSTNLVPFDASFPNSATYPCSAYAGSYGIPVGATQGNVTMTIESNPTSPKFGQVIAVDASGCSVPYVPPYSPPVDSFFGGGFQMCWPDGSGGMICQWF